MHAPVYLYLYAMALLTVCGISIAVAETEVEEQTRWTSLVDVEVTYDHPVVLRPSR